MKKPIIFILLTILCFCFAPTTFGEKAYMYSSSKEIQDESNLEITSKSALLLDYDTGTVVYEKNADERLPIASMTKLATLSIVFDALSKGTIHESDMVSVSNFAADTGGSSAFLDAGSRYKLTDLIKSVIIASANDSSVALAEFVSGTEESFVVRMNKLAASLKLNNTHFANCTGLPVNDHYSSANDIAKIYKTMCTNQIYKKYAKIWMEDFIHPSGRKTGLVNTNRLVKTFDGIEGGKTGYTDAARFCLTASAKRGGTRLIGVIIGANDSKTRFAEMGKLLSYGFANYSSKVIVNSEIPVAKIGFKKSKQMAEVYPERNSTKFLSKTDESNFKTEFEIKDNTAPLKAGDVVGKMIVLDQNNMVVDELNLIIKSDIETEKFADIFNKLVKTW